MHSLITAIKKYLFTSFIVVLIYHYDITNNSYFCLVFISILLHEKFLQFDWLRAVVFQLNLKHLLVKITKPSRVVV